MSRYSMVIDLDRCTGCQACVVACRLENNIAPGGPRASEMGRSIAWASIQRVEDEEGERSDEHRDVGVSLLPHLCNHCSRPSCIKVCPVGATYLSETGIVGQIYPRCIGCRYCTVACPFTSRFFNWSEPEFPEGFEPALNPDVAVRPKGVVEKCTYCAHRISRTRARAHREDREVRDGEIVPACAAVCPTRAMTFGDLDDPDSEVSRLARSPRMFRVLEYLGTEPKTMYLAEGESDV